MNKRMRIPKQVVRRYSKDINFLTSTDFFFNEAIKLRTIWISELDYEVSKVEIVRYAKALLGSSKVTRRIEVSAKASSSSKRIGKKRKVIENPLVANIERVHDAQHEHEINVKST